MKIQFGSLILSRGSAFRESPIDLQLIRIGMVQDVPLIGADTLIKHDAGNQQHTLRFKIVTRHKSLDETITHALLHSSQIPAIKGALVFEEDHQKNTLHLTSAVLKRLDTHIKGLLTYHLYEFVGGQFIIERPSDETQP